MKTSAAGLLLLFLILMPLPGMTLTLREIRSADSAMGADVGFSIGRSLLFYGGADVHYSKAVIADTAHLLSDFDALIQFEGSAVIPHVGVRIYGGTKQVRPFINCSYYFAIPDGRLKFLTSEALTEEELEEELSEQNSAALYEYTFSSYTSNLAYQGFKIGIGASYAVNDMISLSAEFGSRFNLIGFEPRLPDPPFSRSAHFINISTLAARPYSSLALAFML
jgi:hypothetical protein